MWGVCAGCGAQWAQLVYRDEQRGWVCERCAPARRACENQAQGCSYRDIDVKCWKHEWYFCQQRTQCRVCGAAVERGSLSAHYDSTCREVCGVGSTWRATRTGLWGRRCLVSGAAGTAVCFYWLDDRRFDLYVHSPVSSERLREFGCVVHVTQPATGEVCTYTSNTLFDNMYDWHIVVEAEDFPIWDGLFDVLVDVSKVFHD